MKALITGSKRDSIVKAQLQPFNYSKKALRERLGFEFKYIPAETFSEIGEVCQKQDYDVVFLMPFWGEDPELAGQVLQNVREKKPDSKIIFIDPWAQASSKYFNLLPYVDWFLKRQRYQDVNEYKRHFIGGSMFTDFLANQWHYNFEEWYVGSEVPEGYENRIISGWNLGLAESFKKELFRLKWWPIRPNKTFDIFCRMSLGKEGKKEWYYEYRYTAVQALKSLNSDYSIMAGGGFQETELVPRRQYYRELGKSRIVFSPFGWGENCWRDFEAIIYDCLLVKPSMAHLDTQPNIFIEGETYVPVKWDFSDLEEKCRYYLEHPEEATRIVKNARQVYEDYFRQEKFVQAIKKLV